jgi:hypothetical protein
MQNAKRVSRNAEPTPFKRYTLHDARNGWDNIRSPIPWQDYGAHDSIEL